MKRCILEVVQIDTIISPNSSASMLISHKASEWGPRKAESSIAWFELDNMKTNPQTCDLCRLMCRSIMLLGIDHAVCCIVV